MIWGTTLVLRSGSRNLAVPTFSLAFALRSLDRRLLPVVRSPRGPFGGWPRGRVWLAGDRRARLVAGYLLIFLGEERVPGRLAAVVIHPP